jgi:hypothetical protein
VTFIVVRVFDLGHGEAQTLLERSLGRIARLDILVYEDAGQWSVERRVGGVEGRSQCPSRRRGRRLDRLRDLLAGAD